MRSIAQAADGYLWIATAEGVVRFDGVRFSGFEEPVEDGLSRLSPRALFALESGEVWVVVRRGGLLRWDGQRLTMPVREAEEEISTALVIQEVLDDGEGGVFFVSKDEVLHTRGDAEPRPLPRTPELESRVEKARAVAARRAVTGAADGPLELRDHGGDIWRRTEAGGLAVLPAGDKSEALELPGFNAGTRVMALMEDREGNVWAATNGDGLHQLRKRRVTMLDAAQTVTDRHFVAVIEDREGTVWAGNKSGGISRFRDGAAQAITLGNRDHERNVTALCEDANGVLWASKNHGALFRHEAGVFHALNGESSVFSRIMAMTSDTQGRLWLGGQAGLAAWSGESVMMHGADLGVPREQVTALVTAEKTQLWAGMAGGRVFRGDEKGFVAVPMHAGAAISAILPDADDSAWVTTAGDGLFWIEKQRVIHFSRAHGLPDTRLTCVLDDADGHLWLGSLSGIFRVEKAALREVADGHETTAAWLHLDRADGLLSRECVGGTQPAGWRRREGSLLFPTVNGIASIDPRRFETNPVPPLVQMESVSVQGVPQTVADGGASAGPGRSRLEFHFTALSFAVPEKVRFKTRLAGLHADWQDIGTQRVAAYESVPPGEYVFEVMAANNDGVWSEKAATLAVRVLPQFWERAWFRVLAVLMVIAGAVAITRARERGRLLRLEAESARQAERARIARDLHDDLGASLTEISLIAGLAAEKDSEGLISTIAGKTRHLVGALDEIVWAVNPRHDTLASLVEYVTASAAELLESGGIALRLEVDEKLPELPLTAEQRHAVFLAVREALNNVVKHSGASEVHLSIQTDAAEMRLRVTDNGRGFSIAEKASGDGLRNMRQRLEALGGTCQIASSMAGTSVAFSLPLSHA